MLVLLVGALGISHLYPQAAFPGYAMMVATLVLAALAWGILVGVRNSAETRIAALAIAALAIAIAWPAWWIVNNARSPVAYAGTETMAIALQGLAVFAVAMIATIQWPEQQRTQAARMVAAALLILASGMALHAFYQMHGPASMPGTNARSLAILDSDDSMFRPEVAQGIRHALTEGRAAGRTGQPNVFAGILALALPFALAFAAERRRIYWRAGALIAAALLFAGVVATGSRGGLLAALVGTGTFALLAAPTIIRKAAPMGASIIAAFLVMGSAAAGGGRWLGGGTIRQRLLYWESGTEIWSRNWLFGAGPGAFEVFYPIARRDGAQETVFAHNWFVQWGAEVGIVGVALFVGWAGICLWLGLLWRKRDAHASLMASAFIASAMVLLAHGLVEFTLQTAEPYLGMALVFGVMAGMGLATMQPGRIITIPRIAARVGGIALVAGLFFGIKVFVYDHALVEAAREEADYLWADANDPAAAAEAYTRALRIRPREASLYEARAFARASMGDPRGRDDLDRAIALNPYSARLRAAAATFEANAGNTSGAVAMQREAIERHPLNVRHRVRLAELLWMAGDEDAAREELQATFEMFAQDGEQRQREALLRTMGLPTPM